MLEFDLRPGLETTYLVNSVLCHWERNMHWPGVSTHLTCTVSQLLQLKVDRSWNVHAYASVGNVQSSKTCVQYFRPGVFCAVRIPQWHRRPAPSAFDAN